jgi:phosphate acetyltransferase
VTDGLRAACKEILVNAIPIFSLNNPTIKEIVDELDAKVLFGGNSYMKSRNFSVGTVSLLRNYLLHLKINAR